jgi:putative transposase
MKMQYPQLSITRVCTMLGFSRQAYYQARERIEERILHEAIILDICQELRRKHPSLGATKMQGMVNVELATMGLDTTIGRDATYNLLREHGLLLRKTQSGRRTTNSRHSLARHSDLYKGFVPTGINQAWVSDITYWRIATGEHLYIHLVTDAYSRFVLGWCLSQTLHASNTIAALVMALQTLEHPVVDRLLHHSDRGSQYCSDDYVAMARQHGITMSMTQSSDPRDNAIAERVNGILKHEYLYHYRVDSFQQARAPLRRSIHLYSYERPHLSLNNQTPHAVHSGTATRPVKRLWRTSPYPFGSDPTSASHAVHSEPMTCYHADLQTV